MDYRNGILKYLSVETRDILFKNGIYLWLVASANSPTVVELIGELFIVELLYCNYMEFLKACLKKLHYINTLDNVFN